MLNSITGTFSFCWVSYACVAIGLIYWFSADSGTAVSARLLSAAYAPVAGLLFVASTLTDSRYWSLGGVPIFALAQLLPLALFIVSLRRYSGPTWLRWVLVPVALLGWGWQAFWGYLYLYAG